VIGMARGGVTGFGDRGQGTGDRGQGTGDRGQGTTRAYLAGHSDVTPPPNVLHLIDSIEFMWDTVST